jgi:hypothetical protein
MNIDISILARQPHCLISDSKLVLLIDSVAILDGSLGPWLTRNNHRLLESRRERPS